MKIDEMKLRIKNFLTRTIDLYLPSTNIINRFENATAKLYLEQNIGKLDRILNVFADENGEINEMVVLKTYEDALFESDGTMKLDIKDSVESAFGTELNFLPNKIILFKKEDLYRIFS